MIGKSSLPSQGEIDTQILRALVRKLMSNGVLSQDDVRALLVDAVTCLDDQSRSGGQSNADHG